MNRVALRRAMYPKDTEGIANSVDPDQTGADLSVQKLRINMVNPVQTISKGAVWAGSPLFDILSSIFGHITLC